MEHSLVFNYIYQNGVWAKQDKEQLDANSGSGSGVEYNREYIDFLKGFIRQHNIKSVADIGCGDWRCGEAIYSDLDCFYIGYDIYKPIVDTLNEKHKRDNWRFKQLNCCSEPEKIFPSDLLVVKDVLQHWADTQVEAFMKSITTSGKFKYILITNCYIPIMFKKPTMAGDWRTLSKDHVLLKGYNLQEVFRYNTKSCLLWEAPPTEEDKDLEIANIDDLVGSTPSKNWVLEWLRQQQ